METGTGVGRSGQNSQLNVSMVNETCSANDMDSQAEEFEVGRILVLSKATQVLRSGTWKYVTLHEKEDFVDVIKLKLWEMKVHSRLVR